MKPQDWIIGSQNTNTEDRTDLQANQAWNPLEILKAGILNGMFKKDSEQLKIISDEICNLITNSGITLDPTDHTQLLEAINRIKSSSLQFKGYVATSAPSSSTYSLLEGNMWINSATMPTSFPISASDIKIWNGTAWTTTTVDYTPEEFHTFRNINDGEGYYWFGGTWKVMSTDMSTDYFTLNQTTGLWEIKSSVNLAGNPTTTTPETSDNSTKIATTAFVKSVVLGASTILPGTILLWGGKTVPNGYLHCDGSAVSRTTYADLYNAIGTTWGIGNGSTTFNIPYFLSKRAPLGSSLNEAGQYNSGSVPKIIGSFTVDGLAYGQENVYSSGAFSTTSAPHNGSPSKTYSNSNLILNFDASNCSGVYNRTDNSVIPDGNTCVYIIKY